MDLMKRETLSRGWYLVVKESWTTLQQPFKYTEMFNDFEPTTEKDYPRPSVAVQLVYEHRDHYIYMFNNSTF